MKQNYKIIKDEMNRYDIVPTDDPHDNETIFDSFRNCKRATIRLIYIDMERLTKTLKLREEDLKCIRRLFIKNFQVNEELPQQTEEVYMGKEE